MEKAKAKERIEKLKELINRQRYLYHVKDAADIGEAALDSLKHELFLLEKEHPELTTSDSPTQRIGGEPLDEFVKVKHAKPMISLEDCFSEQEMIDWQEYVAKLAQRNLSYFCELKIDGFAVSLIYRNGKFVEGSTRGDGKVGEDVTANLKTIESIPLAIEFHEDKHLDKEIVARIKKQIEKGEIEIRGEVYMSKAEFERINKEREKEGLPIYANPRNLAAGSIRQLDPKIAASRKLSFSAYDLVSDFGQQMHSLDHEIMRALGFRSDLGAICHNLEEVFEYFKSIEKKREKLDFLIDGVVVNVDDNKLFDSLGVAGKAPRGARAYKFSPEQATTIVEDIKVQVGRTGTITPVAHLKPVELNGVIVKRATLHNMDQIERLDVKIGDTVVVDRAGDVIPAVTKVLIELRTGKERYFKMPENCPICHKKLLRENGEVAFRCTNNECPAKMREALYHFVSRHAFNIDGLGPEIIDQLVEEELVLSPADLFRLKKEQLLDLERFAEKSATNLLESIANSKKVPLEKFIYALGIRHVGENTAHDLAKRFVTLDALRRADIETLQNIEDIGPKVAQSIMAWLTSKESQRITDDLLEAGIIIEPFKKIESKISGKNFVITGSLKSLGREEAKAKVRELGGEAGESVGKKTDYLVAGENAGSKLEKAQKLGIKIIDEDEFLELIK
jgi:DNA ligase (NAD+)